MQALKVNSSDSGATTWLRSQIKFVMLDIQYIGSTKKKKYILCYVKVWESNSYRTAMTYVAGGGICAN